MALLSMFWSQKHFRLNYTYAAGPRGKFDTGEQRRGYISRAVGWWKETCYLKRTYIIIGIGTVVQVGKAYCLL